MELQEPWTDVQSPTTRPVRENTGTTEDEAAALAARLVAGRYGELRCLRSLCVVEKNAPALETLLRERGDGAQEVR